MSESLSKTYAIPAFFGVSYLREEYQEEHTEDLRWYFNDLYKFFLYSLTKSLHDASPIHPEGGKKLLGMLEEIISVKNMIETKE